jgi:transglutaminase-like putative cysteine protease
MEIKKRPNKIIEQRPGPAGVAQTLDLMRELVKAGKRSQIIRELAVKLTEGLPQKDWFGEISRIHDFVKHHIRYVKDIRGVETLQLPEVTLEIGAGDCDDKSVLAASLLESIGHPTRFVAMGFLPNHYSHVTVQTRIGKNWRTVETTEPVGLGWVPAQLQNVMVRHN